MERAKNIIIVIAFIVIAIVSVFSVMDRSINPVIGSVATPDGYYATSTDAGWGIVNNPSNFRLLKNGQGVLGQVVITSSSTYSSAGSILRLYDATTTVNGALLPTSLYATTTIADFRPSVGAGTYTFDVQFTRGLIAEFPQGNVASSTITWK